MKNRPEAIIFDLDGTLVDSARDLSHALNHVLQMEGRNPLPLLQVRHMVGQGARAMIIKGFSETGSLPDTGKIDLILENFLEHYHDHIADHTIVFPGVIDLLKQLNDMKIPLAVCTNKSLKLSGRLLTEIGLMKYFHTITGGDSFAYRKPDPRHLLSTLDMMGLSAKKAVMVGDSASDIDAARGASIPVIAVPFGYTEIPVSQLSPDIVIEHYDQFFEALSGLSF